MKETLHELEAIRSLTDEEVAKAKSLLRHQLVEEIQSGQGLAMTLAALLVAGAPLETYQRLDAELAALERPKLEEVATALIKPAEATIVLVGDLAKIRTAVDALGLGKAELRDAEGKRR